MTWYNTRQQPPVSQLQIPQQYTPNYLLQNCNEILKQIFTNLSLKSYLETNRESIVKDLVRICLEVSEPNVTYENKMKSHLKALQIIEQRMFQGIGLWSNPQLLKVMIQELFSVYIRNADKYKENQPHLYHGYFQKIIEKLYKYCQDKTLQVLANQNLPQPKPLIFLDFIFLVNEQLQTKQFQEHLLNSLNHHSVSISLMFMMFINVYKWERFILGIQVIKQKVLSNQATIINQFYQFVEKYLVEPQLEQEMKVQNILCFFLQILDTMSFRQYKTILLFKAESITLLFSENLFFLITKQISSLQNIIMKPNIPSNLKILALQILTYSHSAHIKYENENLRKMVPIISNIDQIQTLTNYFIDNSKLQISSSFFISYFSVVFIKTYENDNLINLMKEAKIIQNCITKMINNPQNNIFKVKVEEFIKNFVREWYVFLNLTDEKQLKLIEIFIEQIKGLLDLAERNIGQKNNAIFHVCSNMLKMLCGGIFRQISEDFRKISESPQTNQFVEVILKILSKWMSLNEKYHQIQSSLSVNLGCFFEQDHKMEYKLIEFTSMKSNQLHLNNYSSNVKVKQEHIEVKESPKIEIKIENKPDQGMKQQKSSSQENKENFEKDFDTYMKKRKQEIQSSQNQSRKNSLSKTPPKLKGQSKKKKSRWQSNSKAKNPESQQNIIQKPNQKKTLDLDKLKLLAQASKFKILKMKSNKILKNQKVRKIDPQRDRRLLELLSIQKKCR